MTENVHELAAQRLAAQTQVVPSSEEFSAVEIDECFRLHLSQAYWQWLSHFQSDSEATIQHHPDLVFHDQRAVRELQDRPGYLLQRSRSDGTSWAAGILPKTVTLPRSAGLGLRRQVRGYRLVGSRFFGAGDVESHPDFQQQMEQFLRRQDVDFLLYEDVLQPSPTWSLLTSRQQSFFRMEFLIGLATRFRIRLPQNPDDYWRGFSKNARKQNRRLLEDNQRFTLWRATEVAHVPEFLEAAKQVAERSWQSDRLQVRLCEDESRLDLLTFLAQHGMLRSYVLFDGQTPIAFEFDHQLKGYLVSEEAAYDQRYSEHAPGRTLLLRVLHDLFEHDPPAWYDFAAGDWDYKRRFANDESQSAKLWLVKRDVRFGVISALMQAERAMRSGGRRIRELVRSWTTVANLRKANG